MPNALNFGGIYDAIEFPPYKFQEFPKMVGTDAKGKPIIVNNVREQLAYNTDLPEDQVLNPLLDERDALAKQVAAQREQLEELKALLAQSKTPVPAPSSGTKGKAE